MSNQYFGTRTISRKFENGLDYVDREDLLKEVGLNGNVWTDIYGEMAVAPNEIVTIVFSNETGTHGVNVRVVKI